MNILVHFLPFQKEKAMHACQKRSNRYICVCGKRAVFLQRTTGKYVSDRDHEYCQRCWKSNVSKYRSVWLNVSEVVVVE